MTTRKMFLAGCGVLTLAMSVQVHASETQKFYYDAKGRLVKVDRSGSVNDGVVTEYGYDKSNNRTNVKVTQSSGGTNSPPVANPDVYGVSCLAGAYPVVFNDTDPDGDNLSLLQVSGPLGATISGTKYIYVYGTSSPGTYYINYTIQDGNGGTASSTLRLVWAWNPACGGGGGGGGGNPEP